MSIKFEISMLSVCFLALLATKCVSGVSQKITFYDQPNCAGRNEMMTGTNNNLRDTWMANATSTRVVGVWKIEIENKALFGMPKYHLGPNNAYPPEGRCINKFEWPVNGWQNFTIFAAVRFGPLDLSTPQLILYTGHDFTGTPFTINNNLDQLFFGQGPVQILSYAHFGNESWTLFSETMYNGTTTLLRPSSQNGRDHFEYDKNANMLVGSVRKGQHDGSGGGGGKIVASLLTSVLAFVSLLLCK